MEVNDTGEKMKLSSEQLESGVWNYIEEFRELLSSKTWENLLLNSSKNELFVLWMLYRQGEVNMSQLAEYMNVPLNTATGIISRMEKRQLVIRQRSEQDKRIVTVCMSEKGSAQIRAVMKECLYYAGKITEAFSAEEMDLFMKMLLKVKSLMQEEHRPETVKKQVRKIVIE